MQADQLLTFGPYRFEPHTRQIWRGKQEVKVTGKASALLYCLLDRAGQVVTKDELFAAVWSGTVVSDAALTSCVQELRQALHDPARKPLYIETVHRRGFCFIGKVVRSKEVVRSQHSVTSREEPSADGQEIDAVLPQAGIQEFQTEALSESPWIPASAGMTPLPFSPQNDLNGEQEPVPSPLLSHPEQPLTAAALPTSRAWSVRNLVFMGLVLLIGVILTVQYLSRPSLSPQLSFLRRRSLRRCPCPTNPPSSSCPSTT